MSSSCKSIVEDVAKCLRSSPCMTQQRRDFHDCLGGSAEDISSECERLRKLYFECKRAQLDMRKRFRGNPGY